MMSRAMLKHVATLPRDEERVSQDTECVYTNRASPR